MTSRLSASNFLECKQSSKQYETEKEIKFLPSSCLVFVVCHSITVYISLHSARKYGRIFLHGHICSEKRTVFRERSSMKTLSFEAQIISNDKHPNISSRQMGATVFIILQIFFAAGTVLKIGEYHLDKSPSFIWDIFSHAARLDQSRASENI